MGLGAYPGQRPQVPGHAGHARHLEANNAMQNCDVLLAVGARFDDRVIGNPKHFAQNERKIIHVDIDPSASPSASRSTSRSSATSRTC
jgi:acetolactate synthase-1/2/3 large subunit